MTSESRKTAKFQRTEASLRNKSDRGNLKGASLAVPISTYFFLHSDGSKDVVRPVNFRKTPKEWNWPPLRGLLRPCLLPINSSNVLWIEASNLHYPTNSSCLSEVAMAFTTMSSAAKAATVLLLIIAASTVSPVSASTMWAYQGSCSGPFISWRCRCRNLTGYKGGYVFNYSGGWVGRFYYGFNCGGPYVAVARSESRCSPHRYNSVYIPC